MKKVQYLAGAVPAIAAAALTPAGTHISASTAHVRPTKTVSLQAVRPDSSTSCISDLCLILKGTGRHVNYASISLYLPKRKTITEEWKTRTEIVSPEQAGWYSTVVHTAKSTYGPGWGLLPWHVNKTYPIHHRGPDGSISSFVQSICGTYVGYGHSACGSIHS